MTTYLSRERTPRWLCSSSATVEDDVLTALVDLERDTTSSGCVAKQAWTCGIYCTSSPCKNFEGTLESSTSLNVNGSAANLEYSEGVAAVAATIQKKLSNFPRERNNLLSVLSTEWDPDRMKTGCRRNHG